MVCAFLIHTLRARPGEDPEPCQLLFCRVFAAGGAAEAPHPEKKERLRTVARQVETACRLQLSLSGKRPSEHLHQPPPEEAASLQETPFGVFRLPAGGDPFPEDKTVLWLGVQGLAFALVCDPEENLMLAEGTLRLLARALLEHLKLLTAGSGVLLKADRTEAVLDKFLPHGQLLFLNDQFVVGLEKELSVHLGK